MENDNTFTCGPYGVLEIPSNSMTVSQNTAVSAGPTVFDTARYILEKLGEISTMKLQKLCYYAQAWSLVWDDAPLFNEDFRAWANGPVCRELFRQTQGKFSVCAEDEPGSSGNLSEDQKASIDAVLEYYGDKNAQWLSQLSHMEAPWKDARKNVPPGVGSDNIITKESMAMYYSGLQDGQ